MLCASKIRPGIARLGDGSLNLRCGDECSFSRRLEARCWIAPEQENVCSAEHAVNDEAI